MFNRDKEIIVIKNDKKPALYSFKLILLLRNILFLIFSHLLLLFKSILLLIKAPKNPLKIPNIIYGTKSSGNNMIIKIESGINPT